LAAMRPRLLIAAALVAALVAAGCGEKGESEATAPSTVAGSEPTNTTTTAKPTGGDGGQKLSPEQQIEVNVADVIGGGDPNATCADLVTARYVNQAYGDEQGCRAAVSGQSKFGVAVSAVEIRGAGATARAKPAGGPNKGETLKIELVQEGKTWKVNSAISNAPAGP
jgi:hypothetical protein